MAFNTNNKIALSSIAVAFLVAGCSTSYNKTNATQSAQVPAQSQSIERVVFKPNIIEKRVQNPKQNSFSQRLSSAARERTRQRVVYDGRYLKIGYPWGDVPANMGVCTDVVIRSYRRLGIDLQQQVHQDMSTSFDAYPNLAKWQLNGPDPNIDHRRVYNLKAFFSRHGVTLPRTPNPQHYQPGDIVTWKLAPGQEHIGIVVNQRSKTDPSRHLIVHNIAEGPKMEDVLFAFPITGHYRYFGNMRNVGPTVAKSALASNTDFEGLGTIPEELLR